MTTDEIELFAALRPEVTPLSDDQFNSLRERALSTMVGVDGEGPMTINLTAMPETRRANSTSSIRPSTGTITRSA